MGIEWANDRSPNSLAPRIGTPHTEYLGAMGLFKASATICFNSLMRKRNLNKQHARSALEDWQRDDLRVRPVRAGDKGVVEQRNTVTIGVTATQSSNIE